jgi:endonuclease VIII
MPEGNTIHWLARVHTRDFAGRRVRAASPQGRFAREAQRLDGRRFESAEAYGKHLFHHWSGGLVVHVHLGMAGWFYRHPAPAPPPRETVRLRLATRDVATDLIGPPTCELIPEFARRKLLARLGPDPLRRDFDPDRALAELARRPRRSVGDALLDQRVLAGVGNIYRAEALFLTGIHPKRPSRSLSAEEWERLWKTVRALMRRGVVRGRIRTIEPGESPAHPLAGRSRADAFYVYQQAICRRCASPIEEFPMSARRMFACPRCQPARPQARGRRSKGKSGRAS